MNSFLEARDSQLASESFHFTSGFPCLLSAYVQLLLRWLIALSTDVIHEFFSSWPHIVTSLTFYVFQDHSPWLPHRGGMSDGYNIAILGTHSYSAYLIEI